MVVLIAALLATALLPAVAAADGPPPSSGPEVALPPDASVFVVPAGGGAARLVTPPGELAFDPEWRPRTASLVVVTERGLLELQAEGGFPSWNSRRTLHPDPVWSPSFSPDGSTLAFVDGSSSGVSLLDIATLTLRQLRISWRADGFLDWAPSGRELAVTKQGAILRVDVEGDVVQTLRGGNSTCFGPAWAPTGNRLAFACLMPALGVQLGDPRRGVYSKLTPRALSAFPAWSPDGRRLAYSKFVDGSWELFVRELKTGRERRVVRTPYDEVDPAWSPDGRLLAYVSNRP